MKKLMRDSVPSPNDFLTYGEGHVLLAYRTTGRQLVYPLPCGGIATSRKEAVKWITDALKLGKNKPVRVKK